MYCTRDDYNEILEANNYQQISEFLDDCEFNCLHFGSCDYCGWMGDKLKELEEE